MNYLAPQATIRLWQYRRKTRNYGSVNRPQLNANRRITDRRPIHVIILSLAPAPDPLTPPAAPELLPPHRPPPAVSPQPAPMHRCSPSLAHIAVTSPA